MLLKKCFFVLKQYTNVIDYFGLASYPYNYTLSLNHLIYDFINFHSFNLW